MTGNKDEVINAYKDLLKNVAVNTVNSVSLPMPDIKAGLTEEKKL